MKNETSKWLAISSTSTVVSFIIQTLTTIVLARIFSPNEFGTIASVVIITNYADIFWQMGLGPSIVQKKDINQQDISTASLASLVLGIITCAVLCILSKPISNLVGLNNPLILIVMSTSFVINSVGAVATSLLQRELKFIQIAYKDILSNIFYFGVAVILGLQNFGVWALVIASICRYLIMTIVSLYYAKNIINFSVKYFSISNLKSMMNFGVGYSISRFLNVTTSQIDYLIVSRNMGQNSLGIYSRAFQLMNVPANLMGQVVDLVFFPVMSKTQENNGNLRDIFVKYSNIMALFYFPVSVLLYLFSEEFVLIFLGENWYLVTVPLQILGLSLFFRVGYKITDPLFRAKGAVYERAFLHFIQAILTGIAAFVGVKVGGIEGVAIGVSISLLLNYLLIVRQTAKLISIKIDKIMYSIFLGMILNYSLIFPLTVMKKLIIDKLTFFIGFPVFVFLVVVILGLANFICIKYIYDKNSMEIIFNKLKKRK